MLSEDLLLSFVPFIYYYSQTSFHLMTFILIVYGLESHLIVRLVSFSLFRFCHFHYFLMRPLFRFDLQPTSRASRH